MDSKKRPLPLDGGPEEDGSQKRMRLGDGSAGAAIANEAAARAAAIAARYGASLQQQQHQQIPMQATAAAMPPAVASSVAAAAQIAAQRAAIIKAQQLAAAAAANKPAATASVDDRPTAAQLGGGASAAAAKKTALPPPLMLDASGKPLDALSAVLSIPTGPVASLKINAPDRRAPAAGGTAAGVVPHGRGGGGKDKTTGSSSSITDAAIASNPYLAHRKAAPTQAAGDGSGSSSSDSAAMVDPRVHTSDRSARAKRALHFAEPGSIAARAEALRQKAAKSAEISVYRERGGRLRPVFHREGEGDPAAVGGADGASAAAVDGASASEAPASASAAAAPASVPSHLVPLRPTSSRAPPPDVEWWDAAFLPPARSRAYAARREAQVAAAAAAKSKKKQQQQQQQQQQAQAAASDGGNSSSNSTNAVNSEPVDPILHEAFAYGELSLKYAKTARYVQHPVPESPAGEAAQPESLPLILTVKERKRLRRQARAERLKGIQDQVRLGILPPPEPKVRLANLMRVLKDSAVADPSAVEKRVREQVAARVKNHEMRNLAKKLTPAERREKWKRKMTSHGAGGPDVALFRVSDLAHKQVRFKVDVNASECYLTGMVLQCRNAGLEAPPPGSPPTMTSAPVHMVLVEGGTRAVRRYVKLMTQRINWRKAAAAAHKGDEDDDDDEEEEEDEEEVVSSLAVRGISASGVGAGPGSLCELVWRGTAPRRFFDDWKFEETKSPSAARKLMEAKGLPHMWDLVFASAQGAAGDSSISSGGGDASIRGSFVSAGFLARQQSKAADASDDDDDDDEDDSDSEAAGKGQGTNDGGDDAEEDDEEMEEEEAAARAAMAARAS